MIELVGLVVILAIVVFAIVYYITRKTNEEVTKSTSYPYYPYDSRTPSAYSGYHPAETVYDPINGTIRPRRYDTVPDDESAEFKSIYDPASNAVRSIPVYEDETPPLVYIPATHGQDADPIVNRHVDYDSPNINISGPSTTGDFPSPQTVSDNLSDTLERASETVSHGLKTDWSGGGSGDIYRDSGGAGGGNVGFDSGTPDVKPSGSYTRSDTYPTSSTDSTPNVVSSEVSSTSSGSGFDSVSSSGLDTGSNDVSSGTD